MTTFSTYITAFLLVLLSELCTGEVPKPVPGEWKSPHTLEQLAAAPAPLIPFPRKAQWGKSFWTAPKTVAIATPPELDSAYRAMVALLKDTGLNAERAKRGNIRFQVDTNAMANAEGYMLDVSATGGITVTCGGPAGAFYAVQTLRQLIVTNKETAAVPVCNIRDWPAFGLRGFMHDTGRNFQEIESLKTQIDRLAAYKFNTFHWHLTDNPAWRPQTKLFPQLNDPKFRKPGRNPQKSYSFDDIRSLIRYAADRHVRVIPELDMPGHSEYFERTFGFKMGTEKGMEVLEKLIDEFCAEIPASDCPILHLGSDEVHIPNPQEFMRRMSARVRANGRTPMIWNPGLPSDAGMIEQLWRDDGSPAKTVASDRKFVDSAFGYLNSGDALNLIQRYFFHQPCRQPSGDARALGGILCCWPDVRVDDERKIFLHNPVWPGALAYAEALWNGRAAHSTLYFGLTPPTGTPAWQFFREFEGRLAAHRDRSFASEAFPYVQFGQMPWQVAGPLTGDEQPTKWRPATGGWLNFRALVGGKGPAAGMTMYARTYLHSDTPQTIHAWLGFEAPGRATRRCGGIPPDGEWCAHGGAVFVNDAKLSGPAWKNPGANRFLKHTWGTPNNEIPYDNEEFYWSREPAAIPLKKGWNQILFRVPCGYADQNWSVAFIPVRQSESGRWVEDLSLKLASQPTP